MALQKVTLEAAANVFRVHPRTICRALTGEHNTYWYEDINHDLYALSDIAEAYGMDTAALRRCVEKRDSLLKAAEACEILGMKPRRFRERLMSSTAHAHFGRVGHGGVVRYLESKVRAAKIARSE